MFRLVAKSQSASQIRLLLTKSQSGNHTRLNFHIWQNWSTWGRGLGLFGKYPYFENIFGHLSGRVRCHRRKLVWASWGQQNKWRRKVKQVLNPKIKSRNGNRMILWEKVRWIGHSRVQTQQQIKEKVQGVPKKGANKKCTDEKDQTSYRYYNFFTREIQRRWHVGVSVDKTQDITLSLELKFHQTVLALFNQCNELKSWGWVWEEISFPAQTWLKRTQKERNVSWGKSKRFIFTETNPETSIHTKSPASKWLRWSRAGLWLRFAAFHVLLNNQVKCKQKTEGHSPYSLFCKVCLPLNFTLLLNPRHLKRSNTFLLLIVLFFATEQKAECWVSVPLISVL